MREVELLAAEPFKEGLVQVYTGPGKGKTTAALGLALRAAGQGLKVHIVQFMKGVPYGELNSLGYVPNISLAQFGRPQWVDPKEVTEEDKALAWQGFEHARQAIFSGQYQMVILDEINVALSYKLLPLEPVLELIHRRPKRVELVLTGRGAPRPILELADLVTKMQEVKHPYRKGLPVRRGIEF